MTIYRLFILGCIVVECLTLPTDNSCSAMHIEPAQCSSYWSSSQGETANPPLLLVSLDGFRAEYFSRLETSSTNGIVRLARCGVKAASMMPVFPTITLPNHYSIVTGLYPSSHGIVAHEFFDPILKRNFSLPAAGFDFSNPDLLDPVWWTGEPIWYTIKRQGKKSASYFWPGSFIDDPVRRPNYWFPYDRLISFEQRISQVIDWLLLPIPERPSFIALYLEEPDSTGHEKGPESEQMDETIRYVDSQIEFLLDRLSTNGILGCVDIIILSDHGMTSVPLGQNVFQVEERVPDIRTAAYCFDCSEGMISTLRPVNDTQIERDRIASQLECINKEVRIYDKWDLPRRHHYANNQRISSLIFEMSNSWRAVVGTEDFLPGGHGWDNLYPEMQAIFIAQGPSFLRDGSTVSPFQNIDLYNLMCWLSGVDPAPNNGTWGALNHLLVSKPPIGNDSIVNNQEILVYPPDETVYLDRLEHREACQLLSGQNDPLQDSNLNLTESVVLSLIESHAPWGTPSSTDDDVKVLVSRDLIVGFNVREGIPIWVSYTITNDSMNSSLINLPWRLDPRLRVGDLSLCDRLKTSNSSSFVLAPLFFPRFCSSSQSWADGLVETNVIDISQSFAKYWQSVEERIGEFLVNASGRVNVMAGPVRNWPSPSVFLVVSYCQHHLSNCSGDELQVQSFLLPTHLRYNRDCLSVDLFLRSHLASVRDVERESQLTLYSSISAQDKVQLLARTVLTSHSLLVDPRPPVVPQVNHAARLGTGLISWLTSILVLFLVFQY